MANRHLMAVGRQLKSSSKWEFVVSVRLRTKSKVCVCVRKKEPKNAVSHLPTGTELVMVMEMAKDLSPCRNNGIKSAPQ